MNPAHQFSDGDDCKTVPRINLQQETKGSMRLENKQKEWQKVPK